MSQPDKKTYGQIMKSSALIGGSSVLSIACGIVRTKVMAVLLGPSGFGLMGMYWTIGELARSVAGMGINTSGVRQIAEAVGSGDAQRIARTVTILRRVAFGSGALGALLLVVLCKPISWLTFNDYEHAGAVALLAVAVFFGDISNGQAALVQGMRRIGDLAWMSVWGALYGTLFSIPVVYFYYQRGMAERGVVPSLICVAAMGILTSWWYARKIKVERVRVTLREIFSETSALLKMGFVFMASGLMTMGVAYLVRIILIRKIGLEAAGFYQSAWTLGGFYAGFILQAMGADFYPRLTAVAKSDMECNRLVNEQAEVGLLISGPGIIATLTFAPLFIVMFYSAKFEPAVEIFRWICLGMMLRVVVWPMAFILLAKGEAKLYFWVELISNAVSVGLVWIGILIFGLKGTGIAFFGLYVIYGAGILIIVRRLSGFQWSAANRQLAFLFVPLVAAIFLGGYFLPRGVEIVFGAVATFLTAIYSLKKLCALVPLERFPRLAQKLFVVLRLTPSKTSG